MIIIEQIFIGDKNKIEKIADKILKSMNNKSSNLTYDKKEFELFYGS